MFKEAEIQILVYTVRRIHRVALSERFSQQTFSTRSFYVFRPLRISSDKVSIKMYKREYVFVEILPDDDGKGRNM